MTERQAPAPSEAVTCYRHRDRETGVRCVRCDRPICPECMRPASVGFQCPECVREGRRTARPARTAFGGRLTATRGRDGQVTYLLIGVNVAVFLVTLASGSSAVLGGGGLSSVYRDFALSPRAVAGGDYYRLVTAMFLHFSVLHIAFNMWALYVFGPALERALGRLRYAALYFAAGLGGSALSYLLGSPDELAAGASGAIFGLLGAWLIVNRRFGQTNGTLWLILGINFAWPFLSHSNVDIFAHLGGLVAGALAAAALAYAPRGPWRSAVQAGGFGLCLLAELIMIVVRTTQLGP